MKEIKLTAQDFGLDEKEKSEEHNFKEFAYYVRANWPRVCSRTYNYDSYGSASSTYVDSSGHTLTNKCFKRWIWKLEPMKEIKLTAFDFGLDEKENPEEYFFNKNDFLGVKIQINNWHVASSLMPGLFVDNDERS